MGLINIGATPVGNSLQELLMCDEIVPGEQPSYQICKVIYTLHPLGAKMVDAPVRMAQSQEREIAVPDSPEDEVKEQFLKQWKDDNADKHIFNARRLCRMYGISSVAVVIDGVPSTEPLQPDLLWKQDLSFNVFDPLNTAGSLVLNQNPNALDFQKTQAIRVGGQVYHRSRSCVILHEDPIYIDFTESAYGFVGRSVFQRALFPLKSFVNSMIADDMVARKVGVLIAKLRQPGAIIDNVMQMMMGVKRSILKEAQTNNVINISTPDEEIESLNLQNLNAPHEVARKHIIENVATAADMPAKILLHETFAAGFGEGTEDAKYLAQFIDRERIEMKPLYDFFDGIVQRRAWNPEFYLTIQAKYPEYKDMPYNQAFFKWKKSFKAPWPSLLREPLMEIQMEDVKFRSITSAIEVIAPLADATNRTILVQWLQDNMNDNKMLFSNPLQLDLESLQQNLMLEDQAKQQQMMMGGEEGEPMEEEPKPANPPPVRAKRGDSQTSLRNDAVKTLVAALTAKRPKPRAKLNGKANGHG